MFGPIYSTVIYFISETELYCRGAIATPAAFKWAFVFTSMSTCSKTVRANIKVS